MVLLSLAACQRPGQRLPPPPIFAMPGAMPPSGQGGPPPRLPRADQDSPATAADFARYAGATIVYFDHDSATLSDEASAILDRQARWLVLHPSVRASLQGHADEEGTREYRFALGERRAAAMRFYLSVRGVASARLATTSFGKKRPVAIASDRAGGRPNRRGETVLVGLAGAIPDK